MLALGVLAACSGQRYSRPHGPAPVYEPAPLPEWDAGTPPEGAGPALGSAPLDGGVSSGFVPGRSLASLPTRTTSPVELGFAGEQAEVRGPSSGAYEK